MEDKLYAYTQREYRVEVQGLYPVPGDENDVGRWTCYADRHCYQRRRYRHRYRHHQKIKYDAYAGDYRSWKRYRKHQWRVK